MPLKNITPEEYQAFRRFLEGSCGIVLGENKQYLVSSRLGPLMAEYRMETLGELVRRVENPREQELRGRVIEAMTTNETQWFRDTYPFDILRDRIFPDFHKEGRRDFRVWSAACSSGQEAYSISIAIEEFRQRGLALNAEIVGTDISPAMVAQARDGRYGGSAIARGLTAERRDRYFRSVGGGIWEVRPEVKQRVRFMNHNLLEGYGALGRFHLIFCRNVLIYFSSQSRDDILRRMLQVLNPGGYLIVGASESLGRHAGSFEMVRSHGGVIYRLRR